MNPEQARDRLARVNVNKHERDALRTIANMRPEYIVQGKATNSAEWVTLTQWSEELPTQELEIVLTDEDTGETHRIDTRIACRYVTSPQPLGDQP